MGITPLVFTGISEFSDDFQTILDRSVGIASLPLIEMQNEQADLLIKKQGLSDLRGTVANLASTITALGTLGETRALSASSSNTGRVSVSLNGASAQGTYTITEITSVASAASETSASGYATEDSTAVSTDGIMELALGSNTYEVDLTGEYTNSLEGLRDAINALDAGVSASILNTGTGANPYYLSITALDSGATSLELRETAGDSGSNILTADNQGSDAVFKFNGLTMNRSENTISDVVEGLTFTINSETEADESVTLSLSSSRTELASKLGSLVSDYNTVREQVNLHIGENAGLLSGDYIVREVQDALRSLVSFESEGAIPNLIGLGIELDAEGVMSFDTANFYSMSESEFNNSLDLMGSETSGIGGLASRFTQISDPISGLIRMQQDQYDVADERLTEQIDALATRIDYMQQGLSVKLQQADVLLAQLASQQTMLEASVEGLKLVTYGKETS